LFLLLTQFYFSIRKWIKLILLWSVIFI
jgi:hypothetical protein